MEKCIYSFSAEAGPRVTKLKLVPSKWTLSLLQERLSCKIGLLSVSEEPTNSSC